MYEQGSEPDAMYYVRSGTVEVHVVSFVGTQFLATLFGSGEWFGEVPILDGSGRVYRASAVTPAEVVEVGRDAVLSLIRDEPEVLLALTRLVCRRYRLALSWIEDASLNDLPIRLAKRLILAMTDSESLIKLSQESIASFLGVSRQTVNRQLRQWEQAGLVKLKYRSVEIVDVAALERIVASRHGLDATGR